MIDVENSIGDSLTRSVIQRIATLKRDKESDASFAARCGIKQSTFSTWINNGKTPSIDGLIGISNECGVSIDWLIYGAPTPPSPFQHPAETQTPGQECHDDELSEAEALAMTRDVIRSKTVYRRALLSNIRAFHQAVTDEDKMRNTEMKVDLLITQVSRLTSAIEELQGKDQPEKKRAGNDH